MRFWQLSDTIEFSLGNRGKKIKKYTINDRCELNNEIESLNGWRVVNLEISKLGEIDDDGLVKDILRGIESRMLEKIMMNNDGEMKTSDPAADVYYIVE